MASSTRALAASLERVAARLRRKLARGEANAEREDAADALAFLNDLEEEDAPARRNDDADADDTANPDAQEDAPSSSPELVREPEAVKAELVRVESFIRRADDLGEDDGKFRELLKALHFVVERGQNGHGSGKLVIFTESRVTQDVPVGPAAREQVARASGSHHVLGHERLEARRWPPSSDGAPRSRRATGAHRAQRSPCASRSCTSSRRRSRVFISTEAGAKGLNLQFCDTVVNYDLPWNPQRIEQRIGRCHRYGQKHDVTVINFLARDNEAQQLTFEILSQKLELFGTVLDASDQVLHRSNAAGKEGLVSALGADLETELRRIYDRARTLDEVTAELRALREKVEESRRRFEETHQRTAGLIESHFDDAVQEVFRTRKSELPGALADFDEDLERVVTAYLEAAGVPFERTRGEQGESLRVAASPNLPPGLRAGVTAAIGPGPHTPLHLAHPLVLAAVDEARSAAPPRSVDIDLPADAPEGLARYTGQRGRLRLVKVFYGGFERLERLVPVAVLTGSLEVLDPTFAHALFQGTFRDRSDAAKKSDNGDPRVADDVLEDATEEVLFALQGEVDREEQARFESAKLQADRFLEDRLLVLRRRRQEQVRRLDQAIGRRDGATSSEARTTAEEQVLSVQEAVDEVNETIGRLERRDDDRFRTFQDHIHARRYGPPRVEHLFDLEFAIP